MSTQTIQEYKPTQKKEPETHLDVVNACTQYLLPVVVLTAIGFFCFARTLSSYFIADDFQQISYVSNICNGNLNALISNFTGNYMQIPVMKIYRPCLLLSLVSDYMLWHTKAFGYFLTNILYFIASAIMLYALLRELTRSWTNKRSMIFSLLSSALFTSNPLHCESISFISGRDSLLSAFFYLLSLWCFVRRGSNKSIPLLAVGIASFWIAMLSKETAIGLPIVFSAMVFFLPEIFLSNPTSKPSIVERLSLTFNQSKLLWLNTAAYLLVRFMALGTLTGGYTGSIGAGLMSGLFKRWTDLSTISKIIYPLNTHVFGTATEHRDMLSLLYTVIATLVFIKYSRGKYPVKALGVLALWIFTTIAPLYQLWALGEDLAGSRFFFFLSIPLAIFIPLLILAPQSISANTTTSSNKFREPAEIQTRETQRLETRRIEALGAIVTASLVLLCINITYKNNLPWVHAGKQSQACMEQAQRLAKATGAKERIVILGLPDEEDGAHIIYNGATFNTMMTGPFCSENYSDKFITFNPVFYGASELINAQRLKSVLLEPNIVGPFVWNKKTLTFDQLSRPNHDLLNITKPVPVNTFQKTNALIGSFTSSRRITSNNYPTLSVHSHGLLLSPSHINPYQYDFIELAFSSASPKDMVSVFWRGDRANSVDWCDAHHPIGELVFNTNHPAALRMRLSDHWQWFSQGNISQLQLEFIPGESIQLQNMRLLSAHELVPSIAIADAQASNIGVYSIRSSSILLNYDGSAIKGCSAVKIEISKPNYFYEGLSPKVNSEFTMSTIIQPTNKGQLHLNKQTFLLPAFYQIQATCLDKTGLPIGEKSDPLTVSIDS